MGWVPCMNETVYRRLQASKPIMLSRQKQTTLVQHRAVHIAKFLNLTFVDVPSVVACISQTIRQ